MPRINIISNISSKKHAGEPFCIIDQNKEYKIENDKIELNIEGKHNIQIGYIYTEGVEGGNIIHYDAIIFPKEKEEWYLYKVPILLSGKGKMKKISKIRFKILTLVRRMFNSWLFYVTVIGLIYILSFFYEWLY